MRGLVFCSITCVLCTSSTLYAAIKYTVNPVTLSGGYKLESGFIETDGTLGELMPANITDYEIVVTGPLPYTFEDTNPGASIAITQNSAGQGLFATTSSLTVTDTDLDLGSLSIFKFRAMDNADPDCVDCRMLVHWLSNENLAQPINVAYELVDFFDLTPDSDFQSASFAANTVEVARVPEPRAILCLGLFTLGALGVRRLTCRTQR